MIFTVDGDPIEVEPEVVIVAGFTGRDRASVGAHVDELRAQGVPTPGRVPTFYEVAPDQLTHDGEIIVVGGATSGEAEIAIVTCGDRRLVTLASDHTDREAESVDIELSKRVCPKPLARDAWDYAGVADRWDELELAAWIEDDGARQPYQAGSAADFLRVDEIEAAVPFRRRPGCWVLLMGTLPVIGPIRPSRRFAARLHDPGARRSIELDYTIRFTDHLRRP